MRRLVSCFFEPPQERGIPKGADTWRRLARVMEYSARQHCPGWSIEVVEIAGPEHSRLKYHYVANTLKLDWWATTVLAAANGDEILLIDADAMILRPLDLAWTHRFDFAYTVKPGWPPFNAGVVFLSVSPKVKTFVAVWRDQNRRMLDDKALHQTWQARYNGINQAALGMLLETGAADGLALVKLPCWEWNLENDQLGRFDPGVTRIVHIKNALRRDILKMGQGTNETRPLARIWATIEAEAREAHPPEATP